MLKEKGLGDDDAMIIETQLDFNSLLNIYCEIDADFNESTQACGIFSAFKQNL